MKPFTTLFLEVFYCYTVSLATLAHQVSFLAILFELSPEKGLGGVCYLQQIVRFSDHFGIRFLLQRISQMATVVLHESGKFWGSVNCASKLSLLKAIFAQSSLYDGSFSSETLTLCLLFLQLIGWQKKEDALRMMLIVTDAGYHFAGDGLVSCSRV